MEPGEAHHHRGRHPGERRDQRERLQADYPNVNDFSTDSQAYVTNSQPFDDIGNVANVWNLRTHSHIATVTFPADAPYYVEAVGPAGWELLTYGYGGTDNGDGTLTTSGMVAIPKALMLSPPMVAPAANRFGRGERRCWSPSRGAGAGEQDDVLVHDDGGGEPDPPEGSPR